MAPLSRRETLQRIGASALVVGASAAIARGLWDEGQAVAAPGAKRGASGRDYRVHPADASEPELAIARGPADLEGRADGAELARRALGALGGMQRFVGQGDVVTVKPNIGWDRTAAQAANTNPVVVAEIVRLALAAGASKVVVTDFSCNDPDRAFQRSGIRKAASAAGAQVILPAEHRFRPMRLGGEALDEWPVFTSVLEADKVINVPIAKHHGLSKMTCALKNWYGLIGGRRNRLHQNIDVSIADLASFIQPTLTVVDATRVLWRNGPQGGNLADTKDTNTVIASTDQVAADAYACQLLDIPVEQIPYLGLAESRGIGTTRWQQLRRKEV